MSLGHPATSQSCTRSDCRTWTRNLRRRTWIWSAEFTCTQCGNIVEEELGDHVRPDDPGRPW